MTKWTRGESLDEDVVLSTRIRLARNLKGFRFTNSFDENEAETIRKKVRNAVDNLFPNSFQYFEVKDLEFSDKILMENYLISPELIRNKNFSAFCLSEDEKINIMINEDDQIRFQVLEPGLNLDLAYEKAENASKKLGQELDFAYDYEFGFLTSCLTNTGTGLKASCMVHLPAITKLGQMKGLVDSLSKLGIAVRGIYGENSEALGSIYQISNQKTLGISEFELIKKLKMVINSIVEKERDLRNKEYKEKKDQVEDKVFRALGALKYSRLMTDKEAIKLLSDLRMGISLGIYREFRLKDITEMIISVQKYNMSKYMRDMKIDSNIDFARAYFIRSYFKEV